MKALYAFSFGSRHPLSQDCLKIIACLPKLDQIIQDNAPKWPLVKINKVDLAVLRVALWELLYRKTTPPKVVIDEAVELAKEYGTESSPGFINGVLGSAVKKLKILPHDSAKNRQAKPTAKNNQN